jgi:carboxypeptidase Q
VRARLLPFGVVAAITLTAALATPGAQAPTLERIDLDAIQRIKEEGLQRSQVMDTAWYLTEVHGPRLTNSPGIRAAAAWTTERLSQWGLANVKLETWGPFGRGWTNDHFAANVVAPQPFPLIAFPRAWTPGTNGAVTGDAVVITAARDDDLKPWAGKLQGRIVLTAGPTTIPPMLTAPGRRFTPQELTDLEAQTGVAAGRGGRGGRGGGAADPNFTVRMMRFFATEGVLAVLQPANGRNDRGTILVTNAPRQYRDPKEPPTVPQLMVASEHYNRISRLLEGKVPVRLALDVRSRYIDDTQDSFNIIAEIPGTDKADEVVMLGAHFDSWHAGTGATDNAAGSAAMMEAIRILKASGLRMRRTVRLALWTGEEQGLFGSEAYVKQHFGDAATMALKPAHGKLSVYFNMDNGTGAIRGVYLQGNEAVRPVFAAWMEPLRSLGVSALTIRNTGSTDHTSFDAVGLPGFQFIQDPLEYSTHTHHTNMDTYDKLQAEDLMKNSVIIASFVYHAANRDAILPRKALPRPRPAAPPPAGAPAAPATR